MKAYVLMYCNEIKYTRNLHYWLASLVYNYIHNGYIYLMNTLT